MRRLIIVLWGLALLVPGVVSAGISGSDHDMRTYAGGGTVTKELCFACHVPHNASGSKLWARTIGGPFSGVQNLCYTCHDGTISTVGSTTAFDAAKEQHKNVGGECSADGACHDVHNQNPNTTGRFLVVADDNANATYCDECHDATPFTGAEALGDHTTSGNNHAVGVAGTGGTLTCDGCHTPHGATAQSSPIGGLTNPALLASNNTATVYGQLCVSCHNGTAPTAAVSGTGGVSSADVYNYSETGTDGTETKHPTMAATGGGGFTIGGCNLCHDVHNPGGATTNGYVLKASGANSAYCVSCHNGTTGPTVGANSHPVNAVPSNTSMNTGSPALPWAQQIDEDGTAGADWASATTNWIVCESCHSVHRQGFTGAGHEYFLRNANSTANELCVRCHSTN
ncbi:MAG TPA: cytochrome c3 family protein [Candidatus Deferrimicrobium sp.]|nr:cytochrome c3 family protein [Candidatus Deferrimicrobium sp.]